MKRRLRAVGIIVLNGGIVLIHRKNVKYRKIKDYYVLPGVICENQEQFKEKLIEEIYELIGLKVEIKKLIFHYETEQTKEYFYICEYITGKFKNLKEVEAANAERRYAAKTFPEIIRKEELKNICIMPEGLKDKLLKEMSWDTK